VDEIIGLYSDLPLIPNTEMGFEGLVQLKHGRFPVLDLRKQPRPSNQPTLLPTLAVVEWHQEQIALVFDLADEVIPVNSRGLLNTDLQCSPLPARARTVTRQGDVFWLNLNELAKPKTVVKSEYE